MTPAQRYIAGRFLGHCNRSHPTGKDVDEASLIDSYVPSECIYCGPERIKRDGFRESIMLEGRAWLDETYYSVLLRGRARGRMEKSFQGCQETRYAS